MGSEGCTNGMCGLDPMSRWRFRPTRATISMNWDNGSNPSDVYIKMWCPATASSVTSSTDFDPDTNSPTWTMGGQCTLTAQQLTTTGFAFQAIDDDGLFGEETVCSRTTVVLTAAELLGGSSFMRGPVGGVTSITFSVMQVP